MSEEEVCDGFITDEMEKYLKDTAILYGLKEDDIGDRSMLEYCYELGEEIKRLGRQQTALKKKRASVFDMLRRNNMFEDSLFVVYMKEKTVRHVRADLLIGEYPEIAKKYAKISVKDFEKEFGNEMQDEYIYKETTKTEDVRFKGAFGDKKKRGR